MCFKTKKLLNKLRHYAFIQDQRGVLYFSHAFFNGKQRQRFLQARSLRDRDSAYSFTIDGLCGEAAEGEAF
jgi:hypothetical protein